MTTAVPTAVPTPTNPYTRDAYERAALLRLADALRGTEFETGFVLRINHDLPAGWGAPRTIQVVNEGGEVVASLTPDQVLHSVLGVLLHSVRWGHGRVA